MPKFQMSTRHKKHRQIGKKTRVILRLILLILEIIRRILDFLS